MIRTRFVFLAACAGMLLFGMVMLSLGTVHTFLTGRFGLDPIGVASLAGLLPFGILAGSLIFGPVVDRFGYRIPLTVAAILILVAFETVAAAATFVPVQAAFFFIGLGGGVINGGTNALVADISGENRGSRLSILGVFFGIGALGMPMATALLLRWFTPASIIAGFGASILLPVILFLAVRFPAPKQVQGFPIKEGAALIRDTTLLLLSMILFFESAAEGLVNNWTPAFLQHAGGLGTGESLYMLTILSASLTVTRLVLGGLLSRIARGTVLTLSLAIAALGAGLLGVAPGLSGASVAMVFIGIGFAAGFPVILGIIGGLFPQLSGTAFGIALVIALTGNTVMNTLLGVVSGAWGIAVFPWYLMLVFAGLGVFLALGLRSLAIRPSASRG
jgi:MFS family permease